jgi:PAS domain S-box-containing protein
MPAFAAQYQFAAAFTVFLVALAGLALVILRAEPLTVRAGARTALAAGFLGVGAAAFLQGSLIVADHNDPLLAALRLAGAAGLLVGSAQWRGNVLSRALLWAGVAGLLVAVPLDALDVPGAAAAVSAASGLSIGAALLSASRRAIAARVAASAAATLLLVVLVLSVALSAVLASTVEDQALTDLDSRASQNASAIEGLNREVLTDAAVVATLLGRLQQNPDDPSSPRVLAQLDPNGVPPETQRLAIENELKRARDGIYNELAFVFVNQAQRVVAANGLDPAVLVSIAGSQVVQETLASSPAAGRASTQVLDRSAFVVGAAPLRLRSDVRLGAVVAVRTLDHTFLAVRAKDGDSLALVGRAGLVAEAGKQPSPAAFTRLAGEVLGASPQVSEIVDNRFVAVRPVRAADNRPILALVASRPTTAVDNVRESLFRTFFVIAFGGTVLALVAAALVGDRIGSGLRRLTTSAEAIQGGDFGVRSGIRSEDEVGVLAATFDSMAASIEEQTDALAEAAARVEAIVAGMGEALVAVDGDARITDFNAAAEELVGIDAVAALGQPIDHVLRVRGEDGEDLSGRLRRLDRSRWSALGALGDDGVPVALTVGALRSPDGEVIGGVVVLRDLRGEREVERMKRHFLSRVGHELRTPLTPLIGYSQMLAGRQLPPDRARGVYASILSSAKRLERIVEMLEFFASLDAGRDVLTVEPVDVRVLLRDVVDGWAEKVDAKHTVARRIAKETPGVRADARWLARSVDELIDNAVKFSPKGGRVVVSAGPAEDHGGMVEISVRDVGVGMTEEELDRAFTEWSQGDESDTRSFGGLGLGLALVQRVTERLGGRVVCTTATGKGSKFSILLPALPTVRSSATRAGTRSARADDRRSGGGRRTRSGEGRTEAG